MNSPFNVVFNENDVLNSKEQLDELIGQSPLLNPEEVNEAAYAQPGIEHQLVPVDVEQQNSDYAEDLGWGLYRDEINNLLIQTTGQPGQSITGSFQKAVAAWKRVNGLGFNGLLDKETWGKMATRLRIPSLIFSVKEAYAKMSLASVGLPFDAFRIACNGFRRLDADLKLGKQKLLSIVDFTQTSEKERLYILNLADQKLLIQTKVAHGKNSMKSRDKYYIASRFSNEKGKNKSSLGFYITAETFCMPDHTDTKGGRHERGYALWIDGQEKDFNSNARSRGVVIHQAEYVPDAPGVYAKWSLGCPAVSGTMYVKVIDTIKEGSCFFIYYNDLKYLRESLLAKDLNAGKPFMLEPFKEPAPFHSKEEEEYENEGFRDYEEWNETQELFQHDSPPTLSGTTELIDVSAITGKNYRTGVFIPASFIPGTKQIDLVIYLHGQYAGGSSRDGIDKYWKSYSHIREHFSASGRNAILMAPTLGADPEKSNFVFKHPNGFNDFVTACFNKLKSKRYIDADAQPFRIVLAAHSAGGYPLRMILAGKSPLLKNIIEVWGFDCFYNYGWPCVLYKSSSVTFFHYHAFKNDGSITVPGTIAGKLVKDHPNLLNIAPAKGIKHQQVIEYAWTKEVNARDWLNGSSPAHEVYEFQQEEYEWEEASFETDEALEQELEQVEESEEPITSLHFTSTEDLTAEEAAPQTESEFWITKIVDKVVSLSFWIRKGPAILFYLTSLFQKGQKDPAQLTEKIFNDILHPERKGKPIDATEGDLQKEWNELYNFVVGPFLLSAGYALKTLPGNVLIPGTPQPVLLKLNEYGLVQFPESGNGFARYTGGVADTYKHPVTGVTGKHGDNWMNPETAVGFYNLVRDFHTTAEGSKIIIHYGDSSAYDPSINLGHKTHNKGQAIDLHYFGPNGEEFSGTSAWSNGDAASINIFLSLAVKYGFTNIYSYGKRYKHPGNNNHAQHKDHFHIGQAPAIEHFYEFEDEIVRPDYEDETINDFNNDEEPEVQLEEVLFEGLVPTVSVADLKTRLDDYLNKANAAYLLDTGSTINCFSQFRLATTNVIAPEVAKEKVKKQLRKTTAGAKFATDNSQAIHVSAYGRATPDEVKKITQALIDSGALAAIRTANPGNTDSQLVRKMQRSFGVGTDCAGYVQMAYIFAYTGNDSNPASKRLKLGLKAGRGDENLASLTATHFKKLNILDAQTGDLLILNARPADTDRAGHTVIIADHIKTGTKHEFIVDASWGVDLYGLDAGGIARRSFLFDTSTGIWADKHPLTGARVHENTDGPYAGHIIAGLFRPRT